MTTDQPTDRLSTHIVYALAAATDTDPFDLDPPLFHVVDLDALDRLFRTDSWGRVQFEYDGHAVVVESDRSVSIDGERYDSDCTGSNDESRRE